MGQFITPDNLPEDTFCRQILIPNDPKWIGAVSGALMVLMYPSEWQQLDGISAEDAADRAKTMLYEYWASNCSGGDCMNCCIPPAITKRINPETGLIEQSSDGGLTWTPASGGIQSYIIQPVPPVTSGVAATKCDAATNVMGQINVWIEQVSNDFTTATSLVEFGTAVLIAILAAIFTVLSLGALTPLEALVIPALGAALAAAWGAGKAVFDAYWSTEVKDSILCAAYCNIGDDGSYTDEQFSAFWQQCNGDLPGSPAKMLYMGFLSSIGKEGLNSMAASGSSADADCADCDCFGCPVVYWPAAGGTITQIDDCTYRLASVNESGHQAVYVWFNNPGSSFDATKCGHVISWALHSGADVDQSWNECDTGSLHLHSDPSGHCCSQLYFTASGAFEVDIFVSDC